MRSQEPNKQDIKELQETLGQRIAQIAERLGGKRVLAEKVGLSEGQIYRYINAQSDPPSKVLVKIADIAEVSLDWLLKGKLVHLNSNLSSNGSSENDNKVCFKDLIEWLSNRRFGGDSTNLQIIQIESDQAMKPTLGIGDLVIVDRSKREIEPGIYYIRLEDSRDMVRRLQYLSENTVRVISDEPAYTPITLPIEKLKILGRVVWIGKDCL